MLRTALARQGMRVAFVPSLMMVNRERCRMGGFFFWLRRQLLAARLYHPAWPAVAVHGIGMPLLLAAAVGLLAAAVATRAWAPAAWSAAGLLVYEGLAATAVGRVGVRRPSPGGGPRRADRLAPPGHRGPHPGRHPLDPGDLPRQPALRDLSAERRVARVRYRVDGAWQVRLLKIAPIRRRRPRRRPRLAIMGPQ